jgi:cell division protein FtsB
MREFQDRKKMRKIFYSRKMVVLLFVISGLLVFSTTKVYFKSREAVSKSQETKKELDELNNRNAKLEEDVSRLQKESGVEQEIREKFNVQKPGERVLIIVEKNGENGKIDNDNNTGGFFRGIIDWIKSRF